MTNKRAELPEVHPSATPPSFFQKIRRFLPLLTKGLALSGRPLLIISISKNVGFGNRIVVFIPVQL
jgi:hypothetical protein